MIEGDYPGDGKPKPVAFPNPSECHAEIDGISFLSLPKLIELKLASGMTSLTRAKDIGDVQELIDTLNLPLDIADQLNPFVRDRYRQEWNNIQQERRSDKDTETS